MKPIKKTLSLIIIFLITFSLVAQGKRVALVVGNGAYESNPLNNPPNDADDIGEALEEADFDVTIIKDADLASFERAIDNFVRSLRGAETALFYYAGHGVQVDGLNYLIPTSPRVDDEHSVRARAISVDAIIGKVETSGVKTSLIFLDSCRDNPFPGASRSGTRGLSVVATPKTSNSLIAYATAPGDVAADGKGRNGVFSGAVLNHIRTPGLELSEMMREVRAEVALITKNKQNPRVDDGMKESFYFLDPDVVAARAKAESDKANKELQELEKEIADREAAIKRAKNAREKERLEIEQRTQVALQKTKQLEAENLKKEAERREQEALLAKRLEEQRAKDLEKARRDQEHLTSLALQKRKELEKLSLDNEDPIEFIKTILNLEKAISEVNVEFDNTLRKSLADENKIFDQRLASLSSSKRNAWETENEFQVRLSAEKNIIENERESANRSTTIVVNETRQEQTAFMRDRLDKAKKDLEKKRWNVKGSNVKIEERWELDSKQWKFILTSIDQLVPAKNIELILDQSKSTDIQRDYVYVENAIKANALLADIEWGIQYKDGVFYVRYYGSSIKNLTDEKVLASNRKEKSLAYFDNLEKGTVTSLYGNLNVESKDFKAIIYINGIAVGVGAWSGEVLAGDYEVSGINNYEEEIIKYDARTVHVDSGKDVIVELDQKKAFSFLGKEKSSKGKDKTTVGKEKSFIVNFGYSRFNTNKHHLLLEMGGFNHIGGVGVGFGKTELTF